MTETTEDTENDRTVYEFTAPTDKTIRGGIREQTHRDGLFAGGVGVLIAAVGWYAGVPQLVAIAVTFLGGLFTGVGLERARIMWPSKSENVRDSDEVER